MKLSSYWAFFTWVFLAITVWSIFIGNDVQSFILLGVSCYYRHKFMQALKLEKFLNEYEE